MTDRLALVVSRSSDDGESVIAGRLRHLREAGWDATLFAKGEDWARVRALERRLRRLRPALIHFHSTSTAWGAIARRRLPDSRLVVSCRADGLDTRLPDPELLWSNADLLLFKTGTARERALQRGCPEDRTVVLAPPLARVAPRDGMRRRGEPLRLSSVGPLTWEHGYEHSIHAVALLRDIGIDCRYRIVGGGDHEQAVAFARHQLGLHDQVELVAPAGADDLTAELAWADIYVDAAVADTVAETPLAAARAHGVPFVATPRPAAGAPGGVVVPRRDPRALADALAALARDPERRDRLGAEGRTAANIPSLADHEAEVQRLYRRVLANGR